MKKSELFRIGLSRIGGIGRIGRGQLRNPTQYSI